jgi:hypothetical protein
MGCVTHGGGLEEAEAVEQSAALALQRRFVPAQARPLRPPGKPLHILIRPSTYGSDP